MLPWAGGHAGGRFSILEVLERIPTSYDPRIVKAIFVKKAFHTVSRSTLLQGVQRHGFHSRATLPGEGGLQVRLQDIEQRRCFPMSRAIADIAQHDYGRPHLIPPTPWLAEMPGFDYTISDEVTLWTPRGSTAQQEQTLQEDVYAVCFLFGNTDLNASLEKTVYVVANRNLGKAQVKETIHPHIKGHRLRH